MLMRLAWHYRRRLIGFLISLRAFADELPAIRILPLRARHVMQQRACAPPAGYTEKYTYQMLYA